MPVQKKQRKSSNSNPTIKVVPTVGEEVVTSRIENTNPLPTPPTKVEKIRNSLGEYRLEMKGNGVKAVERVEALCEGNLLNMKLALWEALRIVEGRMRENRGEGTK